MTDKKKEGLVDAIVEDAMEDSDAPEKGNTDVPQTTGNEPAAPER